MKNNAEDREKLEGLRLKYPYMFKNGIDGFVIYRGWLSITVRVCDDVDAVLGTDKRHFRWTLMKEKFGGTRFLYAMEGSEAVQVRAGSRGKRHPIVVGDSTDPTVHAIVSILSKAADEACETCMVCGGKAMLQSYDGRLVTLCANHQAKNLEDAEWLQRLMEARLTFDGQSGECQ